MVRDPLAWNTRPGACEVEPPGAGRSPWSTTVTSSQPRAVSSSASAAPTTPAPTMTTRGPVMPTSIVAPDATQCVLRNNRVRPPRGCQEVRDGSRHLPDGAVRRCARPGSRAAPGAGTSGWVSGSGQPGLDLVGVGLDPLLGGRLGAHLVLGDVLGDQVLVGVGPGEVLHQRVGRAPAGGELRADHLV